ncbi:MAG TPA: prenyltransferase [Anaerolineaceae bacterium]
MTNPSPLRTFLANSRPWALMGGAVAYFLGTGIASYLGNIINPAVFLAGLAAVFMLLLSSGYLRVYFDLLADHTRLAASHDSDPNLPRPQILYLQASLATLTVGAVLTVMLSANRVLNPPTFLILGAAFLISMLYAIPPFRLVYSGYGELINAILLMNLVPALGYMLQTGTLHRLIGLITFPLTLLCLAVLMAISVQHYAADLKYGRRSLLVRLGWQRGFNLHHILILSAYILMGVSALIGLPWNLVWPPMLSLPVALFEIYLLIQISGGAKPRWRLLNYTSLATLFLVLYFLNLALWLD